MSNSHMSELRRKNLRLAYSCDYGRSRNAAIRLFCLECTGGQPGLIKNCTAYECPLWQFRMKRKLSSKEDKREKGKHIPTKEWYETAIKSSNEE